LKTRSTASQRRWSLGRHPFFQEVRFLRTGAEPPADGEAEPDALAAVDRLFDGQDAEVVDAGQRAVGGAPGERELELSRQIFADRIAEKVVGDGLGVRGDVGHLARADTCVGAGGHIAHGVSARLARGEPHLDQPPHDVGGVFELT
jgi:hypothetical protein